MAHVTKRWREHCHCQHGCPTYAEITEWGCGCVEVEIYRDQGHGWDCTDFSGMQRHCGNPGSPKESRHLKKALSQLSAESDGEDMPWVLSLMVSFYVMVFGGIFLLLRWIIRRPWRVILAAGIVGGIAAGIFWSEESRLNSQATTVASETAVTSGAAITSETAATSETGLQQPHWSVNSLGSFSNGFYQVDLWRDDSAGGQVLGRILLLSEDVSKTPAAGELTDIIGNGVSGSLSFAAKLRGEEVSFVGVVRGNAIEGMFSSTRVPEPESIVFSRGERQYEESYESRLQWSKSTDELLACCGPGTESVLDSTPTTHMEQGKVGESVPSEEWATITIKGQEDEALAAQPGRHGIDRKVQIPESEDTNFGLAGAHVYIIYSGAREEDASEVKKRLSSAGVNVSMDEEAPGDSGSYSWNRLMYSECHQEAALAVKELIRDVARITLMRSADSCGPNMVLYLVS